MQTGAVIFPLPCPLHPTVPPQLLHVTVGDTSENRLVTSFPRHSQAFLLSNISSHDSTPHRHHLGSPFSATQAFPPGLISGLGTPGSTQRIPVSDTRRGEPRIFLASFAAATEGPLARYFEQTMSGADDSPLPAVAPRGVRYYKSAVFRATHNSYSGDVAGQRGTIVAQVRRPGALSYWHLAS